MGRGKLGCKAPQLLATAGTVSRGGLSSWLWACGAGGQAGLNPTSPGKTWATSCHLSPGEPPAASHHPASCQVGASPQWPRVRHRGTRGTATPRCSTQGIPRGGVRGWQSFWGRGGVLGDRDHHQPHARSPGGPRPPRTPLVGPSRRLRVRDEQANPILIPDYVPREPLTKAGCGVAIGAGGPGMDPPHPGV